jgi:double-stranded uracil-DNA glycosylase
MTTIHSFKPIYQRDAKILILGSIPGKISLQQQQYYANERNAFWRIMATLLAFDPTISYEQRVIAVKNNAIALWDVLAMCTRESSLDSDIVESTIVPNDFNDLFDQLPELAQVYFNGAKAEQSYKRHVYPHLKARHLTIFTTRLPSTSPAHAAVNFEGKLDLWKVITDQ